MLNIEEIQKILPQRFPFLMIDRVLEHEPAKKVVAIKNVTINEGFFAGHFPDRPVMPGALIIEAMAQAAILLFYSEENIARDRQPLYYLGAVKIRFLNPVFPGDQIKITVEPQKLISSAGIIKVLAEVDGQEVARGEINFSLKE